MLSVYLEGGNYVRIIGDRDGLSTLVKEVQHILDHPRWDHEHFVTETGGGYGTELSEVPRDGMQLIHYMDVQLVTQAQP